MVLYNITGYNLKSRPTIAYLSIDTGLVNSIESRSRHYRPPHPAAGTVGHYPYCQMS